ncbi:MULTISPECIES: aminotransferase class I/II-fold pyridoxal phosphate-dependent enzyme [unclassified Streptomyces]|uniref:aminotransferase class I/II-fold pyridoxal phosphate-dependent enzyme n=1 Tax=unclassified Streptomyces TaxID=2593676 RepID=UPI0011AA33A2|nr:MULTISPECIES: aminotransferase class I/II-fold pyridoxal phosphate-dependent enzyme [Streptomyces]QHC32424.1 aminotransferase class I/II-fold pyridoxal phosphate-dependent enzyme [Streptomyces sp. HF10]WKE68539.1 aminotransferase class I/II-fold pyridoxal phosphate-dependent enzyme [Streptomyces sp. WP-1]
MTASHTPAPTADRLAPWAFAAFVEANTHDTAYRPPVVDGPVGPTIVRNGRELVNFASISFLDLERHIPVQRHFAQGALAHGLSTSGSRMTQGICRPHQELEETIARRTGKERAISFATGLLANIGFVHAMSSSAHFDAGIEVHNHDTVFVVDRDVHWSIWKGLEGLGYSRKAHAFRHNDVADLDRVLDRVRAPKTVVIAESIYSADGTMGPIVDILDACDRHGAISMIDDANGFMVYGPENRPYAAEAAAIRERADFVMVSLSKAIGLEGGAIAGPAAAIDAFELLSGTSMFTAAIQPPTAYAAKRTIDALADDPRIVDDYLAHAARLRRQMREAGTPTTPTESYMLSVPIGSDAAALQMREWFVADGYLVPVFSYPAVSRNQALLRLFPHAGHTEEQMEGFLDTLLTYRRRLGL